MNLETFIEKNGALFEQDGAYHFANINALRKFIERYEQLETILEPGAKEYDIEFKGTTGHWYLRKMPNVGLNVILAKRGFDKKGITIAELNNYGLSANDNALMMSKALDLHSALLQTNSIIRIFLETTKGEERMKSAIISLLERNYQLLKSAVEHKAERLEK